MGPMVADLMQSRPPACRPRAGVRLQCPPLRRRCSRMTSLWLDRELTPLHDPLPDDGAFEDLVVGAGLTGLTTALLLARAGRKVGVVEARHHGAVTTGRTTAKLSVLQGT